jgi:N-acetylmuramoyl-L-alanine amidase
MNFKQAHNSNFCTGRTQKIKYIVIHYTSNDGDTAKNNIDYYARTANLQASAHYFVDEKEVWQSVKEGDTAWHCGATSYKHPYCRNSNSIGIELCSKYNGDLKADNKANKVDFKKYYFEAAMLEKAAELTKELMAKYNIPIENVIRHYDVTGKTCPAPMVTNSALWDKFKGMLANSTPDKETSTQVKIESGNDIDYALKWKYGITFDSVDNEKAFIKELDEMKAKGSKAYWVFYKLVNGQTKTTSESAAETSPCPTTQENQKVSKATYHTEGITHIIECDPMTVKNVETQCATNKTSLKNFVSGTYIMKQANGLYAPIGMCVNEDKLFNNCMTHGKPVATLIVYKDGSVKMKYVSDINKEKDVRFAISGYGVYPKVTASEEGFTGVYSDVLRSTDRPIIGYRSKDNKIVIAVRSASSAERANLTAKNLNLDFAISLDAGGTTTLIVDGKYKFSGDGRMNYGGISWE